MASRRRLVSGVLALLGLLFLMAFLAFSSEVEAPESSDFLSAQEESQSPPPGPSIGRALFAMLATFGLLGGTVWFLRRRVRATSGGSGPMSILGRLPLTRDTEVSLLEVGSQVLVLGTGGGRVTLIHALDHAASDAIRQANSTETAPGDPR